MQGMTHSDRYYISEDGKSLDDIFEYIQNLGVIMQFTGILDKNGKEIYEGDIIDGHFTPIPSPNYIGNAPAGYNVRVFIEWNNTGFLAKNLRKGKASKAWERKPLQHIKEMVVIGNIYENPDLIK